MDLKHKKIAFISLGCDKNKVDLEEMMHNLSKFGFSFANSGKAQIVIINTCAFILSARKEAIDNILEMAQLKANGQIEKIIVTGCLSQRYLEELEKFLPEVDKFVQIKDNKNIVQIIADLYGVEVKYNYESNQFIIPPAHYAFLKIADGCNNACAYCTIPRIRGRYISKTIPEVVSRAKQLVSKGAKELIVVAQDVTRYGMDQYGEIKLIELLEELVKIKDLKWIRLHYCYPELVSDLLLSYINSQPKICKYLDIPLQHIDDKILKDMNRRCGEEETRQLIKNIKTNYPQILIRSTFIVGFPGESRKQFKKLVEFLEEAKLDNVGFFAYSREEGTKAFYMKGQIPEFIKRKRLKKIQEVQSKIVLENNLSKIGRTEEIVVDRFIPEEGYFECRTAQMSPDVDFCVKLDSSEKVEAGKFYKVVLTGFEDYFFTAKVLDEDKTL